jgi:predicted HicB family RNase H-like nuclease
MEAVEVFEEDINSRLWSIPTRGGTMPTIISFRLSEALRSQLEQEASEREISLCSLIRQVLSDHVNELKNDSKQNIINLINKYEKEYRR